MAFSVVGSARLMISTSGWTPPIAEVSVGVSTADALRWRVSATTATTSGEARSMSAIRCATSACTSGGRPVMICDACSARRWAMTSAMVCGCSPLSRPTIWRASAYCRNSNGWPCSELASRSIMPCARSLPTDASSSCWAKVRPPRPFSPRGPIEAA